MRCIPARSITFWEATLVLRRVGEHAGQAVLPARPLQQRLQRLGGVALAAGGLGQPVADPHRARLVRLAVKPAAPITRPSLRRMIS
jgi:hypothetical protein